MRWLARHRLFVLALICFFWTGLIFVAHFFPATPFLSAPWRGQQSFEDLLRKEGRKTPAPKDFVFLALDQSTLELPPLTAEELAGSRAFQLMTERPFPWSREVWALLLDRLFGAGARLVIFDVLTNPPNNGDPAFHAALDRYHDKVVLGANFDVANGAQGVVPNEALIPWPQLLDDRVGFVNFWPDSIDGKTRGATYRVTDRQLAGLPPDPTEEVYESLSARALAKIGHRNDIPRDFHGRMIRFTAPDAFKPHTLYEIFDPELWHANYGDGAFFKEKIVLVGASAQVLHDVVDTPMGPSTLGPMLHLQAMAAALGHEFLQPMPPKSGLALVSAAGLIAWLVVAFLRRPLLCIGAFVAIIGTYLGMARLFYDKAGLLLITVPVLSALVLSGSFSLGFEYFLERLQKLRIRRAFGFYLSPQMADKIANSDFDLRLGGELVEATVIFTDLEKFTTLSEDLDPKEVSAILIAYFEQTTRCILEKKGMIIKYVGDAVMAAWGAPIDEPAHAICAAEAACDLRALTEMEVRGKKLRTRVGINSGKVLAGNLGSSFRFDYTMIGDTTNFASRLESMNKYLGTQVLISEAVRERLENGFITRRLGEFRVAGKAHSVLIHELLGRGEADSGQRGWIDAFEAGLDGFRAGKFSNSADLMNRTCQLRGGSDGPAEFYLRKIAMLQGQDVKDWNGIIELSEK
ncbi:MAG TPA: adenylate/guanylate cyclase domain-containing protein [Candidatus Udaeobacter sp.]